jgi:uncharacterized protein (TIGR03067 family)
MSALVAVLMIVPFAPINAKDLSAEGKKELEKLQGKWKATKVVIDGNETEPQMDGSDVIIQFKKEKFLLAGSELFDVTALDPSTTPKLLDFKALQDMGDISKGTTYEGIYRLDGDTLEIALYIGEGSKRPGKLESPKDSKIIVATFKREK